MGVSAKYFSNDLVDSNSILQFMKKKYKDVQSNITSLRVPSDKMDTMSGPIYITLNNGTRLSLFIFIPGYDSDCDKEDIPVPGIAGRSINISTSATDANIQVLIDIAKEFGGYIQKSDSSLDSNNNNSWQYIEGKKSTKDRIGKIYNLITEYNKKNNNAAKVNIDYMVGFISENLDQLKKL